MMFMTAKVDIKKLIIIAVAVVGVILAMVLLLSSRDEATTTGAAAVSDNDSRVNFLKQAGWEVSASPVQSGQVRIPEEQSEVYSRYNALQKSQGYDLSQYAGKTVMRYVYKVNNFPGATEPVYATLLVYKNQIIGGDVPDTAAKGTIRGLKKQESLTEPTTQPTETAPEKT